MSGDTTAGGSTSGSVGAQPEGAPPANENVWLARLSDNAWLLIVLLVPVAVVAGAIQGAAAGILVLIAAALISVIALFWASVRTLLGETPLSGADAYAIAAPRMEEEQKQAVLRALKDLEFERSVGKISEDDYAALVAKYRAEAKRLLRKIEEDARPRRERVEHLVRKRLAEAGLAAPPELGDEAPSPSEAPTEKVPEAVEKKKKKKRKGDAKAPPEAPAAAPAYDQAEDVEGRRVEIEPLEAPEKAGGAKKSADRPKVDITWKSPLPTKTKESPAYVPPVKSCPECGTKNDPDANFCKKCGSKSFDLAKAAEDEAAENEAAEDEAGGAPAGEARR